MESAAFEAAEVLKEDSHECRDVVCRLHCRSLSLAGSKLSRARPKWVATHDGLAVVGIGETDADGLVDEEHVRVLVPGIRVRFRRVRARRAARTWFASHQT